MSDMRALVDEQSKGYAEWRKRRDEANALWAKGWHPIGHVPHDTRVLTMDDSGYVEILLWSTSLHRWVYDNECHGSYCDIRADIAPKFWMSIPS